MCKREFSTLLTAGTNRRPRRVRRHQQWPKYQRAWQKGAKICLTYHEAADDAQAWDVITQENSTWGIGAWDTPWKTEDEDGGWSVVSTAWAVDNDPGKVWGGGGTEQPEGGRGVVADQDAGKVWGGGWTEQPDAGAGNGDAEADDAHNANGASSQ
ncbi:hypothetical protein R3P38DRAFT_3188628 [Favolaschia claudopus]|uniref:Uncharacterized protein n=1 Tax=Favolaschia claudopus TaxID=2862362 RepID=A0AAW0BTM1_9AGAR